MELSWSPGHTDIKGNEHAEKLAKEAAQEAKEAEQLPAVISLGDVKSAAKESGKKKWQDMWDKSGKGRNLYMFRPKVDHKIKHSYESSAGERIVSQLRMGYVGLNEYLHKCNIKDSDLFVTGYRYIRHLYCLVVQAGFYSNAVECWIFVWRVAGSRPKIFFFTCYILAPNMGPNVGLQCDRGRLETARSISGNSPPVQVRGV